MVQWAHVLCDLQNEYSSALVGARVALRNPRDDGTGQPGLVFHGTVECQFVNSSLDVHFDEWDELWVDMQRNRMNNLETTVPLAFDVMEVEDDGVDVSPDRLVGCDEPDPVRR